MSNSPLRRNNEPTETRRFARLKAFFPILLTSLLAGCLTGACGHGLRAAIEMDKVAESLDRYGFASISTPFLAGPNDDFEFDLDKSAADFFEMAMNNVQGGVRNFQAQATDVQIAVRMNLEQALATLAEAQKAASLAEYRIAKAQAGVQKSLLESLQENNPALKDQALVSSLIGMLGVVENGPEPDLPEFTPKMEGLPEAGPPFTDEQRSAKKAVGAFTPGLPMPQGPFKLTARQALLIASGDSMTQSLLKWLTKPVGNKQHDYELFFCPMIVSVQPGHQTRDRYLADVTVNVDLANKVTNGLEFLSDKFSDSSPPIQVAGVFPVIDAQVVDLVNSRRQLFSLAFQLSMLGFGSQADFFLDYAKRLEQDAQTRSALTTASSYTVGGTAFGFRVEPRFVASKDPTQLITEPGLILESKTFPAMAAVLVNRRHLMSNDEKAVAESNKYEFLVFETSTRWVPTTAARAAFGGQLSIAEWPRLITRRFRGGGRQTEVDTWCVAEALDNADRLIESFTPKSVGGKSKRHLRIRLTALEKLAGPSRAVVRYSYRKPADEVNVVSVRPRRGWWGQHTVLTIRGTGFRDNVSAVTVGGVFCDFVVADKRTLLVVVPPWGETKKTFDPTIGKIAQALASTPLATHGANAVVGDPKTTFLVANDESERELTPLRPSEERMLEELKKKLASGSLTAEQQAVYDRLSDREDAVRKAGEDRQRRYAVSNAWAEVSIAARVPVKLTPEKSKNPPNEFPGEPPKGAHVTRDPQEHIGWILFDKTLSSKSASKSAKKPGKGQVIIERDDEGRIKGVSTGDGEFSSGAELLRLIKDALNPNTRIDLEFEASGGVKASAGADSSG